MKRLILSLMVVAAPVHAFEWPWQDNHRESYSFCRGFVHSGLADVSKNGAARIQLWLDWNDATRAQFSQGALEQAQYEAGKARFNELLSANDPQAMAAVIENECNFGTS
jgi:hypothetical protein